MKETNMEHYRGEIEKAGYYFAMKNREIGRCNANIMCRECAFWGGVCSENKTKWLMSEYKSEPVLTAREKGFVECIDDGWIARDEGKRLAWYEDEPEKTKDEWCLCSMADCYVELNDEYFLFITWEDEEAWSVEELRKLKVSE